MIALSARIVDCVAPKRPDLQRSRSQRIAFSLLAVCLGERSQPRIANEAVSISRQSPPERVIEVAAPGIAPDAACFDARRDKSSSAVARSRTFRNTLAESASRYGSSL